MQKIHQGTKRSFLTLLFCLFVSIMPNLAYAANLTTPMFSSLTAFGVRYEILIFIFMLIGIAVFYKNTTDVAIIGTTSILLFKLAFDPNFEMATLSSDPFIDQYLELINLAGLLLGFGILADSFEKSHLPYFIPKLLPKNFLGGVILLLLIFVISTFLDNIAAALIGYSIAHTIFNKKVHIGYTAAIVAASNAGGAGSVVGDTTTTIMWLNGHSPLTILPAFIPAIIALLFFSFFAARQQYKWSPLATVDTQGSKIDWLKLALVAFILILCIVANALFHFPALGIWVAIYIGKFFTDINFKIEPSTFSSTIFLLVLVFSATLIPIETLPEASLSSTFAIGFVSAVFNNIPLTQLCLDQGGYNWALLSFAVGFGGSMIWFGSSAGVAVCDMDNKARSMVSWIRYGWHIIIGYVLAFLLSVLIFDVTGLLTYD